MRDPLLVYAADETLFNTNGLRLLTPKKAEHTLEFGTAGSIHVEHPLDREDDWKSLQTGNIIRAPVPYRGETRWQPFRIYRRIKTRKTGEPVISVDALHMFYDLNDVMLEDARPTDLNCQAAIQWLFDHPYSTVHSPLSNFTFYSDITRENTAYYQWKTLTAALIGADNCVMKRWGGELFVNGLYFSICETMEESREDAFRIGYGYNLAEIEETVDYTNTFSQLIATNNFGERKEGSVPISSCGLPFNKALYVTFTYSDQLSELARRAAFNADFNAKLTEITQPSVNYTVKYADIPPDHPFQELAGYEVGDSGTIEDSELEIETTQRIMKTVTNLLTGERISTETGNLKGSIARKTVYSNTL